MDTYLSKHTDLEQKSFGKFVDWLVRNGTAIYGMKIPTRFQLIGHVGLSDYQKWTRYGIFPNVSHVFEVILDEMFAYAMTAYADIFSKNNLKNVTDIWKHITYYLEYVV